MSIYSRKTATHNSVTYRTGITVIMLVFFAAVLVECKSAGSEPVPPKFNLAMVQMKTATPEYDFYTSKMVNRVVERLGKAVGYNIEFHLVSQSTINAMMENGLADFAILGSEEYSTGRNSSYGQYKPLLAYTAFGNKTHKYCMYVYEGRGIEKTEDLRGANVHVTSWWYGYGHFAEFLEDAGIGEKVGEFFGSITVSGDIPKSFQAMKEGDLDAIFLQSDVHDFLLNTDSDFTGTKEIACAGEYPVSVILFREDIPKEHVMKVGKTLAGAHKSSPFMDIQVKLTSRGIRFKKVSDEEFDPFLEYKKRAEERGWFQEVSYQASSGTGGAGNTAGEGESPEFVKLEETLGMGNFNKAMEVFFDVSDKSGDSEKLDRIGKQLAAILEIEIPDGSQCPPGMIRIPGGEVETNGNKFRIEPFCIDRFEFPNIEGIRPRTGVRLREAMMQCEEFGKRLPSEPEWEWAARGDEAREYPWGDSWEDGMANAGGEADGFVTVAPAGSFAAGAGPFGCRDMAGNAWEWIDSGEEAAGGEGPGILKGGSWFNSPEYLRVSVRRQADPQDSMNSINGFRCATSVYQPGN